ncbi:unnamed protein product [Boreogadus saida]
MMTGSGNVAPKAMLHMTPSPQLGLFMTTGARLRVQPLRPSGGWGRVFLRTCAKHSGHSAVEERTFGGVNGTLSLRHNRTEGGSGATENNLHFLVPAEPLFHKKMNN